MKAKFLNKIGYSMDVSGEVMDNSGEVNIEEGSEPWKQHQTPGNAANTIRDGDAEKEFPELKPKSNRLPTRID